MRMLHLGPILWLGTLAPLLAAASPTVTARGLLDHARTLDETTRKWTDRSQRMTLVTRHGVSEQRREIEVYNRRTPGAERKALTRFLAPADVRGIAFLQTTHQGGDSDQWLYLPAARRTRRITSQIRDEPFVASAFTYRDLEILAKVLEWTEDEVAAELGGEDRDGAAPCHLIELRPKRVEMIYGRLVLWLDQAQLLVRRLDFYARDGERVKVLTVGDIRDVGSIPTPHRIEMQDLRGDRQTTIVVSEVAYDSGLPDDLFSERYLERGGGA